MPRIKSVMAVLLIAAAGFTACGGNDDTVTIPLETTKLTFSFSNLPILTGSYYQAWAVVGSYGYSIGKFNLNTSGQMIDTTGAVIEDNSLLITLGQGYIQDIGITVEPSSDTLSSPTSYLMGGTPSSGSATLSVDHDAGVGESFASITGKYILATPTDGTGNNELSGLWFIDNSTGIAVKGLNIPEINTGWRYEGWVVVSGNVVSTGKFSKADSLDEALKYGGNADQPGYPGEDFLNNAPSGLTFPTDLSGSEVFVTLELYPDPSPTTPSPFKLFQGSIPTDATDHHTYTLNTVAASNLPSGTVTLEVQ